MSITKSCHLKLTLTSLLYHKITRPIRCCYLLQGTKKQKDGEVASNSIRLTLSLVNGGRVVQKLGRITRTDARAHQYTNTHTHTYTHTHTPTHTYTHTYTNTHIHKHTYTHTEQGNFIRLFSFPRKRNSTKNKDKPVRKQTFLR